MLYITSACFIVAFISFAIVTPLWYLAAYFREVFTSLVMTSLALASVWLVFRQSVKKGSFMRDAAKVLFKILVLSLTAVLSVSIFLLIRNQMYFQAFLTVLVFFLLAGIPGYLKSG